MSARPFLIVLPLLIRPAPAVSAQDTVSVAFTIAQPDLIPEGIAYDPADGTFFVSSTWRRKVVAIGSSGSARAFTAEEQDGLWGGTRVVAACPVLAGHEALLQPTTGVIVRDDLFLVANSQLQLFRALREDGRSAEPGELRPPVVLRVPLGSTGSCPT